jgi:subtilisin family serine protease
LGGARTVQTNKVWPGGIAGTSLTGNGMTNRLGIWDGGRVLTTHQEFGSRVSQTDGTTTLDDHATHVAGTMVATGVSANAKGMSYQAPLKAYYWDNDASEMTAAAAAGMILSNHSYGQVCGWQTSDFVNYKWYGDVSVSATKDYRFGFYDNSAAQFDEIAFNAPNYLICQAAGNDRDDKLPANITTHEFLNRSTGQWVSSTAPRDPDGPYDCMLPSACAKNVLTVGAINELSNGWVNAAGVTMSTFSDWGPTDDGRIKPDVVAKGVGVYSTVSDSNDAYDTYQGTTMATPVTTGSLLLVQQHYNNLKGKFMRSASLKGLIIHTADEAGPAEGPD